VGSGQKKTGEAPVFPGGRPGSDPAFRFQGAFGKVYLGVALVAFVSLVEFVGKNLLFGTATGAVADKGFKGFKLLETGTMLGRVGHTSDLLD
jgi:hypothetical protein